MKTLIIVVHPDIESSAVNKRWIEALQKFPEKFDVHQLYKIYPDEKIDVPAEQQLVEQYEKIVFQFPFYWFSSPPLFKKWLDEVLTHGWAFGSKSGFKVAGKKLHWRFHWEPTNTNTGRPIFTNIHFRNSPALSNLHSNTSKQIINSHLPIMESSTMRRRNGLNKAFRYTWIS